MSKPYVCEYCGNGYTREKTLAVHMCQPKRRALQKNEKRVQLGLYAFNQFYKLSAGAKKQKTYEKNLAPEYDCSNCRFESSTNTFNPNNKQYHQQGAVESSTRLDRLKLNTLAGNTRCPTGTQSNGNQSWEPCFNGNYLEQIRQNTFNPSNGRFNNGANNWSSPANNKCLEEKQSRRKSLGNMMGLYKFCS